MGNKQSNSHNLKLAVRNGDLEAIDQIISKNPTIETETLYYAVSCGNYDVVAKLLTCNVKRNDQYKNPLTKAVQMNKLKMVILLLKNGADPNFKDTYLGSTPLYIACWKGYQDITVELLRYGADPNIQNYQIKCIDVAMASQHQGIVELLSNH